MRIQYKIGYPCNFAVSNVAGILLDIIGCGAVSNGRPAARSRTAVHGSGIKRN
jgi:hypothetical protein